MADGNQPEEIHEDISSDHPVHHGDDGEEDA